MLPHHGKEGKPENLGHSGYSNSKTSDTFTRMKPRPEQSDLVVFEDHDGLINMRD